MTAAPNRLRGEASLTIANRPCVMRPTFDALVRAEEELGSLFALVERAGSGELRLTEMSALYWHCLTDRETVSRQQVGEAIATMGMAAAAKPLRTLLEQILKGAE